MLRLLPMTLVTFAVSVTGAPQASAEPRSSDERAVHRYAWVPRATETLNGRLAAPEGFTRVPQDPSSFGGWLRSLPLAPQGTAVLSHSGQRILAGNDARLAAVVALDVGARDLQQCADSIVRLHAEWQWFRGHRDQSYRLASGKTLAFPRWASAHHSDANAHGAFRKYLDEVFAFANTESLKAQGHRVALDQLRPGDFVVQPGAPGHAVLVLDVARAEDGRRVVLLGQGFMPAQSFHVLRDPDRGSAWFTVEGTSIKTPFWPAFGWETLRRL